MKQGEWTTDKVAFMKTCSECGESVDFSHNYNYCPNCGTKMGLKKTNRGNELIPIDYAERVNSTDTFAETVSENESKSESAENHCEGCTYLGTRKDSSKFCMIPGKTLSTETCDRYKSIEADIAERAERIKLREAAQFIHTYCTNHHNCKGCPFDGGIAESCELVQIPKDWNTDFF